MRNCIDEEKVVLQNKIAHNEEAATYDITQSYVSSGIYDVFVCNELNIIIEGLRKNNKKKYRILDLGCGTGFITSKLYKNYDFEIDAVDIAENMMQVLKKKIQNASNVHVYVREASEFLRDSIASHKQYDLIIFSTFLHHLYDYTKIVRQGIELLAPDGYIYILNEPVKRINLLEIMDTFFHRLLFSPKGLHHSIINALFLNKSPGLSSYNKAIAEYHFYRGGINLNVLLQLLREHNVKILHTRRYALTKFKFSFQLSMVFKRFQNHVALIGKKCKGAWCNSHER